MIDVTRLDGRSFTLNADLIEVVESNPDTYIRLQNGNSFVVRESRQEIVQRVIAFRRQLYQDCLSTDEAVISAQMQPARAAVEYLADYVCDFSHSMDKVKLR